MAPGGLVEVRVSWPGHPRYLKKKNKILPFCFPIFCEVNDARRSMVYAY